MRSTSSRGDPETQVLVLTGAGEAFCAGQDIKLYFRGGDADPKLRRKASRASNQWRWQGLSTFPVPTIAMINGYCFGGGFTQVCACDLALAADEAVFGLSEVNWGILPGGIVSWNVAQGLEHARRHVPTPSTGDTFDGKQAKEIGFVNFSYPKAKLKEETTKLARKLSGRSPPAVLRYTKEAIRAVRFMNEPQASDYLSRQERRVAVRRQGRQPRPGHEAVPGREDLSPRLRRLQAAEAGVGRYHLCVIGRPYAGHPRLCLCAVRKTWMAGTSPAMTTAIEPVNSPRSGASAHSGARSTSAARSRPRRPRR